MLVSSDRHTFCNLACSVWSSLQAAPAGRAEQRAGRSFWLFALSALLCLPISAQYRSGYPANSYSFHGTHPPATNLPPGTGLNGILGSRNPGAGLNGLPTLQNRPYRVGGCFNCGRAGRNYGHDGDRHDNRRREGYGYGAYPFVGGYVPLFDNYAFDGGDYNSDGQGSPDLQPDPSALALGNEVYRLRGEVDRLKDQQNQSSALSAQPTAPASPVEPGAEQPSEPATVIILRNGGKVESTNYAIMNQTLWNFTAKPVQKIPLSSIDLSASERANAERGVDFSILSSGTN